MFGAGNNAKLIGHMQFLFSNDLVGIDQDNHQALLQQIRIARTLPTGGLDKTRTGRTFDLLDAFRLSTLRYTRNGKFALD